MTTPTTRGEIMFRAMSELFHTEQHPTENIPINLLIELEDAIGLIILPWLNRVEQLSQDLIAMDPTLRLSEARYLVIEREKQEIIAVMEQRKKELTQ